MLDAGDDFTFDLAIGKAVNIGVRLGTPGIGGLAAADGAIAVDGQATIGGIGRAETRDLPLRATSPSKPGAVGITHMWMSAP